MASEQSPAVNDRQTSNIEIEIRRPILKQQHLDDDRPEGLPTRPSLRSRLKRSIVNKLRPTRPCAVRFIKRHIPITEWLPKYQIKRNLVSDVITGLTVGIMHIPQGLAYGLLAALTPVQGLYVSFFPVLVYCLLGTSRHISIGTFAVVALMVSNTVRNQVDESSSTMMSPVLNDTSNGTNTSMDDLDNDINRRIAIATSLTLLTGIIQLVMGVFQLGVVNAYLSDSVVSALTTGAAIHVLTSQMKHIFGLTIHEKKGYFQLVKIYIDLFTNIDKTNVAALLTALICIIACVVVKEFLNPRVKAKIKMQIPIELLVIITATTISHLAGFHPRFGVKIVGHIPTGLPMPSVPSMNDAGSIVGDAFAIAIVCFAINISVARVYAKKQGYSISANQELIAYGCANVFGSFFECFVSAGALARSAVQEESGGKTQLVGIVSSALLLIMLLAAGPLLRDLPTAVLGAIIVVNLKGMLLQMKDVKTLWSISKWETATWLVTFTSVVLFDVIYGLLIGVGFSIMTIIVQTQLARTAILGRLDQTDIFKRLDLYPQVHEVSRTKIIRFETFLYFANCVHFKRAVNRILAAAEKEKIEHVIIDCAAISFLDSMGAKVIAQIVAECRQRGLVVSITQCRGGIRKVLGVTGTLKDVGAEIFHLTIHDAVESFESTRLAKEDKDDVAAAVDDANTNV